MSNGLNAFALGCEFVILRIWTVTEQNGNVSECIQSLRFVDTTAPIIVLPPDVFVECGDQPETGVVEAFDNCSEVTIDFVDEGSGNICGSQIARVWTVTDECGNSITDVQFITFEDTSAPIIDCPNDIQISCDEEIPPVELPFVTDNCNEFSLDYFEEIEDLCGGNYNIFRTFIAVDECGNESSCIQWISVVDDTVPSIICPEDVFLMCDDEQNYGDPIIIEGCSELILQYDDFIEVTNAETQITRVWILTDECGNESVCQQNIYIDNTNCCVLISNPGCTYEGACNYDENAIFDNGSCLFGGCTSVFGVNYDVSAACDDGSCIFPVIHCPGDLDDSGAVTVTDLTLFLGVFGSLCPQF